VSRIMHPADDNECAVARPVPATKTRSLSLSLLLLLSPVPRSARSGSGSLARDHFRDGGRIKSPARATRADERVELVPSRKAHALARYIVNRVSLRRPHRERKGAIGFMANGLSYLARRIVSSA